MPATQQVVARLTRRLAVIGGAGLVIGTALGRTGGSPARRAFGRQTAAWGAIDLAIAGIGAAGLGGPPSRSRLRRVLLVNSVLDVGYIAAGAHLAVRRPGLGGRLIAEEALGHGAAVVVQGLALLALDLGHVRTLDAA